MSANSLYVLCWRNDGDSLTYFEGPAGLSQEQFKKTCDDLLPLATEVALGNAEREEDYLGWHKIVEAISDLLPAKGFKRVELTAAIYQGGPFIDKDTINDIRGVAPDMQKRILAHNTKMDNLYIPSGDLLDGLGFEAVDLTKEQLDAMSGEDDDDTY